MQVNWTLANRTTARERHTCLTKPGNQRAQGENRRTCFVISHQLNFIAGVSDRIIVLNEGKVVDIGTHDELLARNGYYSDLYNKQLLEEELAEV